MTTERVLTDEMIEAIKAYFPRYPTRQAVTLPALHIVNEQLRYVPLQAVVEIAELLELAPAEVQDTLSFYGFFKQDAPHGETGPGSAARSVARSAAAKRCWSTCATSWASSRARPRPTAADARIRRMPGRLRLRPLHAGRRHAAQEPDAREGRRVVKRSS